MNPLETAPGPIRRAASLFALLGLFLPRVASAELVQVDVVGTVDFVGCPSAISCPSYPLMWGISGGEPMTLRMVYDADVPVVEDLSNPEAYLVRYAHTLPLQAPLGIEVAFGPYAATVGSAGVAPDKYEIGVLDVIVRYPNYPDISEAIGVSITVPPLSLNLPGPSGFHDLDLRGIGFTVQNYYSEDFLTGGSLPPEFPSFDWEDFVLTVDVYDPVYDRDGSAFLQIESLSLSTPASVPSLSTAGLLLLAGGLISAAWRLLSGLRIDGRDAVAAGSGGGHGLLRRLRLHCT